MFAKVFYNLRRNSATHNLVKSVRHASILADGRGSFRQKLTSTLRINYVNPKSPIPFEQLAKTNLQKYEFPKIVFEYNKEDAVQYALTVGVKVGHKNTDHFLDVRSPNFQVFPTFPLPLITKLLLEMDKIGDLMHEDKTVLGEVYLELIQPLRPEGVLNVEIRPIDVLDKGKGTLYCFSFTGTSGNSPIFLCEYQLYELGTGGWGEKRRNDNLTQPINHPDEAPDAIFEYTTVPLGKYSEFSEDEMRKCIYSVDHPKQFFTLKEKLMLKPHCHGKYYLGATAQLLLQHYCQYDSRRFKSVKVRFTNPVHPGDTLVIEGWKRGDRIHFDAGNRADGQNVLSGGYMDLLY